MITSGVSLRGYFVLMTESQIVGSPHAYVSTMSAESLLLRQIWDGTQTLGPRLLSVFKLGSEKVQVAGSGKHDCVCN